MFCHIGSSTLCSIYVFVSIVADTAWKWLDGGTDLGAIFTYEVTLTLEAAVTFFNSFTLYCTIPSTPNRPSTLELNFAQGVPHILAMKMRDLELELGGLAFAGGTSKGACAPGGASMGLVQVAKLGKDGRVA